MESIVHSILDIKKEKDLPGLKKMLDQKFDVLQKSVGHASSALAALDPQKHTLGFTYILYTRSVLLQLDVTYLNQAESLLEKFDSKQARMCGQKFSAIMQRYADLLRDNGQSQRGILFLRNAIPLFQIPDTDVPNALPNVEEITPLHQLLMMLCLKSKNYKAAVPILEQKIFEVHPKQTGISPRDFLLYFYYGGMIWIGLKEYQNALNCFETAITCPAMALDAIVVEAYKKFILVTLILTGKPPVISKHASPTVHRHIKLHTGEYLDFAQAYSTRQMAKITASANVHAELFSKDKNLGLVKQSIQALYRHNIQRLTQTYLTLSLQDIATAAGLPGAKEVQALLLQMIDSGEIHATINQQAGMVKFEEADEQSQPSSISKILDETISAHQALSEKLKNTDTEISSSHNYLSRIASKSSGPDVF